MLRVVVREDFSKSRCDQLIDDIKLCLEVLDSLDKQTLKKIHDSIHHPSTHSARARHAHGHYKNEKHSLQGKSGKTHAIC